MARRAVSSYIADQDRDPTEEYIVKRSLSNTELAGDMEDYENIIH